MTKKAQLISLLLPGGGIRKDDAAIDPSEDAVSIQAAYVMRASFTQDSPAVRAFFDALVALLTGSVQRQ